MINRRSLTALVFLTAILCAVATTASAQVNSTWQKPAVTSYNRLPSSSRLICDKDGSNCQIHPYFQPGSYIPPVQDPWYYGNYIKSYGYPNYWSFYVPPFR